MFEFVNLDNAAGLVRNIVNRYHCASCDNLLSSFVRYRCGHSSCEDCANVTNECLDCPSIQGEDSRNFQHDPVLTKIALHVYNLKKTFEKAFNVDVYQKKRISDQLKIEKQVFPECIQAEQKYYNKRKTLSISHKNNLSPKFPGENTSYKNMDNKVEKWLEGNERLPISDLDVNSPRKQRPEKEINTRDLSYTKSSLVDNKKRLYSNVANRVKQWKSKGKENKYKHSKKIKLEKENNINKKTVESQNSPILIENDTEIIEDSQPYVDKDKEAQLAVLAADLKNKFKSHSELPDTTTICDSFEFIKKIDNKSSFKRNNIYDDFINKVDNKSNLSDNFKQKNINDEAIEKVEYKSNLSSFTESNNFKQKNKDVDFMDKIEYECNLSINSGSVNFEQDNKTFENKLNKVPFFKKGSLSRKRKSTPNSAAGQPDKVSIVIETADLINTIKVTDCEKTQNIRQSQGVQTIQENLNIEKSKIFKDPSEDILLEDYKNAELGDENPKKFKQECASEDIFLEEIPLKDVGPIFVINSSDSDSENVKLITIEAAVHATDTKYPKTVLSPINPQNLMPKMRPRRQPVSSDSSDKENRDPNVRKKIKGKKIMKTSLKKHFKKK